ncbi:MAG TPA: hypothetical protein VL651_13365 [Bacteroidia bacterium]|jgi:hypothetical protein|nr:hypothetical protein [Bacteroidia bacterium]
MRKKISERKNVSILSGKIFSVSFLFLLLWSCNPPASTNGKGDPDDGKKKHKHHKIELEPVCSLPDDIRESSGLVYVGTDAATDVEFLTHNDSRGRPEIFRIDVHGNLIKTFSVSNEPNLDWEEITRDEAGNIYLGDFGSNEGKRRELFVYKFPSPIGSNADTIHAEDIRFMLPDQKLFPPDMKDMNYDFEAMIHYKGFIYLFSKNRTDPYTGYTKLYRIPDVPGEYTATLLDSLHTGDGPMKECSITGAALRKDDSVLILVSHEKLWKITGFTGDEFFKGDVQKYSFDRDGLSVEGVCFSDDQTLYLTEERTLPGTGLLFRCDWSELGE